MPPAMGDSERVPAQSSGDLQDAYVAAMSNLASGVVMVTTRLEGKAWGVTVSSCISLTASPPTVLISLGLDTASARSIDTEGVFGVSILGESALEVARFGATKGAPKFVDAYCDPRPDEAAPPLLAGALAQLDCEVIRVLTVADHKIYIAEVRDIVLSEGGDPLLYFARGWRRLGPWQEERLLLQW